jgi:hypothetical protein
VKFTGNEQLFESGLTCYGGSEANFSTGVVEPEGQRLGEVLGIEAELMRGFTGVEVQRGGRSTVEQNLDAAEQGRCGGSRALAAGLARRGCRGGRGAN